MTVAARARGRTRAGWRAALAALDDLYRQVDREAEALRARHAPRLQCRRGCSMCCVDGVAVAEVEAERIRRQCGPLLARERPHPPGRCAFLDEGDGSCRIYEHRPYVCRTQGLPLRWIDQDEEGRFVELRDICPLNEAGEPVEELPAEACWTIGWVEQARAQIQGRLDGEGAGEGRRVALRALFGGGKGSRRATSFDGSEGGSREEGD